MKGNMFVRVFFKVADNGAVLSFSVAYAQESFRNVE